MAVRGGIDSLRSPLRGSPLAGSRSVQLALPVVEPRSGVLIPPGGCHMRKKKPVLAYELFLKYGGEGGIDSLRSPLRGSPLAGSRSVQLALPVVEPRSGVLIPPGGCHMRKKKPVLAYELFLKYGGEGGFEPPIRCRIHTFQACSFSHSDTSPYCLAAHLGWATGRYYRELR